jgi:hypothetical protein
MVGAEGQLWSATYEKTRAAVGLGDVAASLRWSAETMALAPVDLLDEAKILRGDALELASRYDEAALIWRDYLASPRPQVYRAQVLVALARAESASRRQEVAGLRR